MYLNKKHKNSLLQFGDTFTTFNDDRTAVSINLRNNRVVLGEKGNTEAIDDLVEETKNKIFALDISIKHLDEMTYDSYLFNDNHHVIYYLRNEKKRLEDQLRTIYFALSFIK